MTRIPALILCLMITAVSPSPALADAGSFEVADVAAADRLLDARGRVLRLAGLLPLADNRRAQARLRQLAMARKVTLTGQAHNRYGEQLAMAYLPDGRWLNGLLVAEGWMLATPFLAASDQRAALFRLEAVARQSGRGHWAGGHFREFRADAYRGPRNGYAIVTGRVVAATGKRQFLFLNFGTDWKTDFTAAVAKRDRKAFRALDLEALAGRLLRLRGPMRYWNGPFMELTAPGQIEILPD